MNHGPNIRLYIRGLGLVLMAIVSNASTKLKAAIPKSFALRSSKLRFRCSTIPRSKSEARQQPALSLSGSQLGLMHPFDAVPDDDYGVVTYPALLALSCWSFGLPALRHCALTNPKPVCLRSIRRE